MVHAGCVLVAGIHPSRTWMSGSLESVRWIACVHGLDLGLYSHLKEFWGNGVQTHVNSKGKISSQRRIEPTTLHQAGQRAQHTTNKLFQAPDSVLQTITEGHYRESCIESLPLPGSWLPSGVFLPGWRFHPLEAGFPDSFSPAVPGFLYPMLSQAENSSIYSN